MAVGRAIIRDTHSREESASMLGYVTMVMVVAPMLAPLAGGYLDEWFGWRSTFLAVLAVGAAVLVFTLLLLHETPHDRSGGAWPLAMIGGFGVLLRDGGFVGYAVTFPFTQAVLQ